MPSKQAKASLSSIRVRSELVVIPVEVFDKKVWAGKAPTAEQQNCIQARRRVWISVRATEPYVPEKCGGGLSVGGLTIGDFRLWVDSRPQKIQAVAPESEGVIVRDNLGTHWQVSWAPAEKWSTADDPGPATVFTVLGAAGGSARGLYNISFVPSQKYQQGCHNIRIRVDRRGSIVHYRDRYCASQTAADTLRGTRFGRRLESDLAAKDDGKIPLTLQAGSFATRGRKDLVRIALGFPPRMLAYEWHEDWTFHASIGVMGVVSQTGGDSVARFSSLACCAAYRWVGIYGLHGGRSLDAALLDDAELARDISGPNHDGQNEAAASQIGGMHRMGMKYLEKGNIPARYETQLRLGQGEYELRIVLSDGRRFGRVEARLDVPNYHALKSLAMSSVMLCKRYRDARVAAVEDAAENFAPQYVPMVSKGVRFSPAGSMVFKSGDPLIAYFEVYEPLLSQGKKPAPTRKAKEQTEPITIPSSHSGGATARGILSSQPGEFSEGRNSHGKVTVEAHIRILDPMTNKVIKDFPPVNAAAYEEPGSWNIPIARSIPFERLPKGKYQLEVKATDSAGQSTPWQSAVFTVE